MKKTLTINISGIIFHIDEDAFNKLNRYLDTIKSHFRSFEGKDEVIADIENRIAEILQQKVSDSKQVITIEDIEEVISIMGQPSDFDVDEEETSGASSQPHYTGRIKRLYRDPENKMVAGVCSGLGAYFNIDSVWVRLIFILMTVSGGFGGLLYVILWVVVPEAWTTTERLEMRGQPVNISNIENSIRSEVDHLKDKINEMAGKTRDTYRKKKGDFYRTQDPVAGALNTLLRVFGRIILIFIGIILLLIGIALSTAVIAALLGMPGIAFFNHSNIDTLPFYNFLGMLYVNSGEIKVFWIGTLLVIGIPVLMLLIASFRLIFGFRSAKWVNAMALYIWIIGIVVTLIFGLKLVRGFRYDEDKVTSSSITYQPADTLHIDLNRILTGEDSFNDNIYRIDKLKFGLKNDKNIFYGIPRLRIRKSQDSSATITLYAYARGESRMVATSRAEDIVYNYKQDNNHLLLDDSFTIPQGEPWRNQKLEVELKLPLGTIFTLDKKMYLILEGPYNLSKYKMSGQSLIMTSDGIREAGGTIPGQTSYISPVNVSHKLIPISILF